MRANGTGIAFSTATRLNVAEFRSLSPRERNVVHRIWRIALCGVLALTCAPGCRRWEAPQFVASEAAEKLPAELQQTVRVELVKQTGTFLKPVMLGATDASRYDLSRGQAVYQERCVQCHGVSGDGNGPAAKFLYPRPRDYRKGIFKFASTPYGYRPLRDDLLRTLRQGVRGTSMPNFNLLPEQDLQAVVDYVLALTRRGEFEQQLVATADSDGAIDPEAVTSELVPDVLDRWNEAESSEVLPASPQPRFTADHVERGKKSFLTLGCAKCHGDDGRGEAIAERRDDAWGYPTRAADLTSGMLHGGNRPLDVYRRIYNGINGTPMPGFSGSLKDQPETVWDLVAYVLAVSNHRRQGEVPPPAEIRPYVPAPGSLPARGAPAAESP
jgi:mono/diheme cytochrome c family protein